jgi:hypothetical protein
MKEQITVSFTKDEWNAVCILVRRHLQGTNIEDVEEKRRKLNNLLQSYEREKKSLDRDQVITSIYTSILEKIDRSV